MRDLREYEMDDLKVDELVFYRDVNDSGRVFANKSVFDRFHIETPSYVIELENGEKIYELATSYAIDILNSANNRYSPYIVRYCFIKVDENKNKNFIEEVKEEVQEKPKKKFIFYRNINDPEKLYVCKEVFDRFHIIPDGTPAIINGVECYEIDNDNVMYISGNAKNNYAPYDVEERGIPLDRRKPEKKDTFDLPYKDRFVIYRNIDHPTMLYVRKDVFKRFHLNTDVEEVIISGIPCYVIDRGDLNYIISNANNSYSPYEIIYRDVKLKAINIKTPFNEKATRTIKIFRNTNSQNRWYVEKESFDSFHLNTEVENVTISGIPCCVIDENDLAYIVGNANNKYSPYRVQFVDIPIDSKNISPEKNDKAVGTIVLYRNIQDRNMFFVRKDVFDRFHLKTEVEDVRINGDAYYAVDLDDLEYIVRNANNKYAPYNVEFRDIPLGKVGKKKPVIEESARDLVDSSYIPGTNYPKPRVRRHDESAEDYLKYLETYYNEIFGAHSSNVKKI